jgi:hypothetical protein
VTNRHEFLSFTEGSGDIGAKKSPMKVLGGLRRLRYQLTSFLAGRNEEEACFETARSARGFSRKAGAVLDDKLAFSATLMRAGEVDAAFRMMREAEAEVLREETALFEVVNNVAAAGATERSRMTRLRLARLLATTLVAASLMVFSVVGFAVASIIAERISPDGVGNGRRPAGAVEASDDLARSKLHEVRLPSGARVVLKLRHYRTYQAIMEGRRVAPYKLTAFLDSLPPREVPAFLVGLPTDVAQILRETMGLAPVSGEALSLVDDTAKKAKETSDETSSQTSSSEESEEASPEAESSEPTDTETEQSDSTDKSKNKDDDGGSSNSDLELNVDGLPIP